MNALNEALALSEFLNNLVNQNYDLDMTTEEVLKVAFSNEGDTLFELSLLIDNYRIAKN